MKVLFVLGHPEPQSFCAALVREGAAALEAQGHQVMISDLYAMGFDPVVGPKDVTKRASMEVFSVFREQAHAADNDLFAPELRAEMDKVKSADMLILAFPMWWYSMPAILKGWVDRVLAYKVAYGLGQWWEKGLFAGRRAMICMTTGTTEGAYQTDGRNGDLDRILWPIHAGTLRMCGYDVLPPFVAYGPSWTTPEARAAMIKDFQHRLSLAQETEPLFFHPTTDFGPDNRLKPEIFPRTPGQHRP